MQGDEEVIGAEEYVGSKNSEAEARALLKAVKLKKKLKEKGEYRKRWNKKTIEVLSSIARVLWESEERNGVIEITYSEGRKSIKEIEIKDKNVV